MKYILKNGDEIKEFPNQTLAADFLGMTQVSFSRDLYKSSVVKGWRVIKKNDVRVSRRQWSQLYEDLLYEMDNLKERCDRMESKLQDLGYNPYQE